MPEATGIFGGRAAVPSSMSAEQWGAMPIGVRERAFWSAKVAHAQHVSDLKAACLDSLEGARRRVRDLKMHHWTPEELEVEVDPETHLPSPGSGVKRGDLTVLMSREDIVGEMRARALERGLTPTGPRPMEDIADESRLRLIGQMAEDTARERARFERNNDPDILFEWPAQELIREEAREKPRDWAARWRAAADDVGWEGVARSGEWIARKDSPIWVALSAFGQPFPPFDYNSGMGVRYVDRDRAVELGLVAEDEEIANPGERFQEQLGASVQGMGDTEREWLKRTIEEHEGGSVTFTPDGRIEWTPPTPAPPPQTPPDPGPDPVEQVRLKQTQARLVEQLRTKQAQMEAEARDKAAEEATAAADAERAEARRRAAAEAVRREAERRRVEAGTATGGGSDDGGRKGPPVASAAAEPGDGPDPETAAKLRAIRENALSEEASAQWKAEHPVRNWTPTKDVGKCDSDQARREIEAGKGIPCPLGITIRTDRDVIDHWEKEGKSWVIPERLEDWERVKDAVQNADEIWMDERGMVFLKLTIDEKGKRRMPHVFVYDATARVASWYHSSKLKDFESHRRGRLAYKKLAPSTGRSPGASLGGDSSAGTTFGGWKTIIPGLIVKRLFFDRDEG